MSFHSINPVPERVSMIMTIMNRMTLSANPKKFLLSLRTLQEPLLQMQMRITRSVILNFLPSWCRAILRLTLPQHLWERI